jgi:hypothetical protein
MAYSYITKTALIICSFVLFAQCRPDVIVPFEPFGSQKAEILALFTAAINPLKQSEFVLNTPTNGTIELTDPVNGTILRIPDTDNTFKNQQNQNVTCKSCAELKLIVKTALTNDQMVAHGLNFSTTGTDIAQTSGAVSFEVLCDGKKLSIRDDAEVFLTVLSDDQSVPQMDLYTAVLDQDQVQTDWAAISGKQVFQYTNQITQDKGYDFVLIKTGWSVGFTNILGAKQSICIDMPSQNNSENTFAYVVLKDIKSMSRMIFDEPTGRFCLGGLPKDVDAEVFVVSRVGDQWQSARKLFTTNAQPIDAKPVSITKTDLIQQIKDLQ